MFAGIMLFAILVFALSFSIMLRMEKMEKGELATYVTLVAWGSLLAGLFLANIDTLI